MNMLENISKLSNDIAISVAGEITKSGLTLETFGDGDHWIIELFKSIEKIYDSMGDAGQDAFRLIIGGGFLVFSVLATYGCIAASEYFHNDLDN